MKKSVRRRPSRGEFYGVGRHFKIEFDPKQFESSPSAYRKIATDLIRWADMDERCLMATGAGEGLIASKKADLLELQKAIIDHSV